MKLPRGWKYSQISNLVSGLKAGVSVNSEERTAKNGELGVLKTSAVTSGIFRAGEHKAILPQENSRARVSPRKNTIVMSRMNTPALVGASAYVDQDYKNLFLPDRLWLIEESNNAADMKWLSYVLSAPRTRGLLSGLATGTSGSMKNISQDAVLSIEVPTPNRAEQEKIAKILSVWDNAVATHSNLLTLKVSQLRHLQYDLVRGKGLQSIDESIKVKSTYGNLPASWKFVELGELVKENKRIVKKPNSNYLGLGIRSHFKGTFLKPDSEPSKIDLEELNQVRARELIVNITFAWEGAIAITRDCDEGALTSHRFPTFAINEKLVLIDFLRYVIRQGRMKYDLGLKSPGGAGRNRVLSKKDFLTIKIPLPPLETQSHIAEILTTQDKQVALMEQVLLKFRRQRQVLLQKLLTGKVRVKV